TRAEQHERPPPCGRFRFRRCLQWPGSRHPHAMLQPSATALPASREACRALDAADPLAAARAAFVLPPGVIYLDGNSLGPMPAATRTRLQQALDDEWSRQLVG
ncbi:MAG TPA: hypothetical protein DDW98_00155, partial [Gammaproteobacteria bacterium]|nr:hypothetical protein [Gammaproteobacteria bacterium]